MNNDKNKFLARSCDSDKKKQTQLTVREHAKKEIDGFLNVKRTTRLIVLDTETNGLSPSYSVLSCSMLKYEIDPATYEMSEIERFCRYYFPIERYEPKAIEKNGLTHDAIFNLRREADYPEHFIDDDEVSFFCENVSRFVGHNIEFDARFIPLIRSKSLFCTMKTNTDIVGLETKIRDYTVFKYPTLKETAMYYGIDADESQFHTSAYDAEMAACIFKKMLAKAKNGL